jgi:UDP:flavonoid glycosyltransferase YjiC (YdhE family)
VRILISTFPGYGHFLPLVPLAWAARGAGHEVLVVTAGHALEASGRAGLPAVDAQPGFDMGSLFHAARDRAGGGFPSMAQMNGAVDAFSEAMLPMTARLFAAMSERMMDGTVAVARAWRPDLVVHSYGHAAGPTAAAAVGAPSVLHGLGAMSMPTRLLDLVEEATRPAVERARVGAPAQPAAMLDVSPPRLRAQVWPSSWPMRYVPFNGGGVLPDWLSPSSGPPGRARVCVTLGTVVPLMAGTDGLGDIVRVLAELDVEVVLALGEADASSVGAVPDNVRVVGWVPLSALLPTCAAIVHHGGAGTVMNAACAGVPQLVLPRGPNLDSARTVERGGIGLAVLPEAVEPVRVRECLSRLLTEASFRRAADEVRREIEAQPSPAEVAARLPSLVAEAV